MATAMIIVSTSLFMVLKCWFLTQGRSGYAESYSQGEVFLAGAEKESSDELKLTETGLPV
jgi:hypothetical protein